MINCTCGLQYVGKTKREFRRRIGDHLGDIRNKRDTAIARHVQLFHDGSDKVINFCVVEVVHPSPRGVDINRRILQKEA